MEIVLVPALALVALIWFSKTVDKRHVYSQSRAYQDNPNYFHSKKHTII